MGKYFTKIVWAEIKYGQMPMFLSMAYDSRYCVQYVPGEWTEPSIPNSKLFIFANLVGAFEFLASLKNDYRSPRGIPFFGKMLWWCEAKSVTRPEQAPLKNPLVHWQEAYWREYPYYTRPPRRYLPGRELDATMYAEAVRLVSPVTEDDIKTHITSKMQE